MTRCATLACSLALLAAGCFSSPAAQSCASDAECGAGNVCQQGSCAGNAPPSADFSAPVAATTNQLISLLPASSDPEGRPLEFRWSIRAVEAGCDPEPEPRDGPALDVVFWCPGTYEATLVPVDELGAEGAPVTRTFGVLQAIGAPAVTVGSAISATHLCDLAVPACQVTGPDGSTSLRLDAFGSDPGRAALTYEWEPLPPAAAAADAGLLVTFGSGRFVASPTASIGNTGGPVGGVYRFRVRVRNSLGLMAQAYQDVVVDNRAPVAAPAAFVLGHRYVDGLYVAEGDVDTGASDPDGDLLLVAGAMEASPVPGCSETVSAGAAGAVHVRITCSVPEALIGQRVRSLSVTIADVNGASVAFTLPLGIANRPPTPVLDDKSFADGVLALDHGVEACVLATGAACFVAAAADPFVVADPDGDPITSYRLGATVAADRSSSKGVATVDGTTYRLRFETPTGFPTQFRSAAGATGFTVSASAVDSFGATGSVTVPLTIRNRSPIVVEAVPAVDTPHSYDASARRYLAAPRGALFEDPDGDPIVATVPAFGFCRNVTLDGGRAVIGCEHAWDYTMGGVPPLASLLSYPESIPVTATDGWESAVSTTVVTVLDRPATISTPVTTVENCGCAYTSICWTYVASGTGLAVPVELVDPDGDPSQLTIAFRTFGNYPPQPPPVTCVPGWCYPTVNVASVGVRGSVTATASTAMVGFPPTAEFNVTATCSVAKRCCK